MSVVGFPRRRRRRRRAEEPPVLLLFPNENTHANIEKRKTMKSMYSFPCSLYSAGNITSPSTITLETEQTWNGTRPLQGMLYSIDQSLSE